MNFFVSHIFIEGSQCVDRLANLRLSLQNYTFWNDVPLELREQFVKNKLELRSF